MKKIRAYIKQMMQDGVVLPHGMLVNPDEAKYIKLYKKDIRGKFRPTVKAGKSVPIA